LLLVERPEKKRADELLAFDPARRHAHRDDASRASLAFEMGEADFFHAALQGRP
jgi:hypothetical protein